MMIPKLPIKQCANAKMVPLHYCISKTLPLIFLLFLLLLKSVVIEASQLHLAYRDCLSNAGNYTKNSKYQSNLKILLNDLVAHSNQSKFYNTTKGGSPDKVFGLFFCRNDIDSHYCNKCVQSAALKIVELCPSYKNAAIFYKECTVRYAKAYFTNYPDEYDSWAHYNSPGNVTDPARLEHVLSSAMEIIIKNAAYEVAYGGFATTEANLSRGLTLYCLAQCTPDILGFPCEMCLRFAYRKMLNDCCKGREALAILRSSCMLMYDTAPYYKLLPPPPPLSLLPSGADKKNGVYYLLRAGIPAAGFIVLLLCAIIAFYIHTRRKNIQKLEADNATLESLQFNLESIKMATNDFSDDNRVGRGGFGTVYKGTLPDGKEVAMKRLMLKDLGRGGDEQFKNEILILAKLQHRNLVTLLGFCLEGEEMLLVYEFMPNSSLDKFIYDPNKRNTSMTWETRFKIINGIVRGLFYLHEQSRLRIIHRDLKAANVLLDQEFNPKISDFGMARLFNIDQTQSVASKIVGTFGYMAPEYVLQGQVSMKSDVYSFGVLVLEIITGQKITSFRREENLETLVEFVWRNWIEGTAWNVVDPALSNAYSTEILRSIHVGLLCVQQNPNDRPTMQLVDLMLKSDPISLPVPSKPGFFAQSDMHDDAPAQGSTSNKSSSNLVRNSINEVSITELHPR